jgi:hypothetical protein
MRMSETEKTLAQRELELREAERPREAVPQGPGERGDRARRAAAATNSR